MNSGMYSSDKHDWGTPQGFFDKVNEKFDFYMDVCASEWNAKCNVWLGVEDDALRMSWEHVLDAHGQSGRWCWMNPPYGREIESWCKKAYQESEKGVRTVGLLPARTDTLWWHRYVMEASEIVLIQGRLNFETEGGEGQYNAPFPSALAVWKKTGDSAPLLSSMRR